MIPKYRIRPDDESDKYAIEMYQGSNVGWTWIKDFNSRWEAEQWLFGGIISTSKDFGDGTFESRCRT